MSLSIESGANLYFNEIPISKVFEGDNLLWTDEVKESDTQYITPTPTPVPIKQYDIFKLTISKTRNNSGFVSFSELRFYDNNQNIINLSGFEYLSSNAAVYAGHKEDNILDSNTVSYFKADFDPLEPIEIYFTFDTAITSPTYFSIVTSKESYEYDPVSFKIERKTAANIEDGSFTTLFDLSDLNIPRSRCKNSNLFDVNYVVPTPPPEGYIPLYTDKWNLFTDGGSVKSEWLESPDSIHLSSTAISYTSIETISSKSFVNGFIDENGELIVYDEDLDPVILSQIEKYITTSMLLPIKGDTLTIGANINGDITEPFNIAYYFYDDTNNYIPTNISFNNNVFINAFINNDDTISVPTVSIPFNAKYYRVSIIRLDSNENTIDVISNELIDNCEIYYGYNQIKFGTEDTRIIIQGDFTDETLTTSICNIYKTKLLSTASVESLRCDLLTDTNKELQFRVYLFDKNMNYLEDLVAANNLNVWKDNYSTFTITDEGYDARYVSVAIRFSDNSEILPTDLTGYRLVFKYKDVYLAMNNKSIGYAETSQAYDVTEIDKLTLSLSSPGNNTGKTSIYLIKDGIFKTMNRSYDFDYQKVLDNNINTTTTVNFDISTLTGSYYIGIANFYGNEFSLYSVNKTDIVHEANSSLRFTIMGIRESSSSTVSFSKIKFYDINKEEIILPECYSVSCSDNTVTDTKIKNVIDNSDTTFSNTFIDSLSLTFNFESIIQRPYYVTIITGNDSIDNDITAFKLEYSSDKSVTYDIVMQLPDIAMTEDRNTESVYYYIGYFKPVTPGPDDPPLPPPEPVVVIPGWIPFMYSNWNLFNTDTTGYLCRSEFTANYDIYLKNVAYKHRSNQTVTNFEQGDYDINGAKYNSNVCIRTSNYIAIPSLALTYSITSIDTNDELLVNTVCFLDANKSIINNELCGVVNGEKSYSVISDTVLLIPKEAKYLKYSIKYLNNSNINTTSLASSTINWNINANSYKEVDLKELDWYLSAIDLITGKVLVNDTSAVRYLSLWNYVPVPENAKSLCVELKSIANNSDVRWFIYCYDSNLNYMYKDECSNFVSNNTFMDLPQLDDLAYIAVVSNYTVPQDYLSFGRLIFELSEPDTDEYLYNIAYAETKNKVDLTMLESVNIDATTALPNSYIYVSRTSMSNDPTRFLPYRLQAIEMNGNDTMAFNVHDLTGEYYIGIAAQNNSEITINAIDKSDLIVDTSVEPVDINRYLDILTFNNDWLVGEYQEDGIFTINPNSNEALCTYYIPVVNSNIVIGAQYTDSSVTPSVTRKVLSKVCYYDINKRYFSDTDWCTDSESEYNYTRYEAPEGTMYYRVLVRVVDAVNINISSLDCKIYFDEIINMNNLYVYTNLYAISPKDSLAYIDTGLKPAFNREVKITFANLRWDTNFILGAISGWPSSSADKMYLLTNNTSTAPSDHTLNVDWYHYYDENTTNSFELTDNEEHTIRIKYTPIEVGGEVYYYNVSVYLDNILVVADNKVPYDFDFTALNNITLFNYLSSSTTPASVLTTNAGYYQLRSFVITEDDVKLIEYIPILDYNDVPCLFDVINRRYIYNANLGSQGFEIVEEPLPVNLTMPDYTGIQGIYHLQSFELGVWKNILDTQSHLNNITFVGNILKSNESVIIPANDYAEVDITNFTNFNSNFTVYIIAKLDDISIKYSHKNLFNTNLIKQSSYFNNDRTSYNITYNLEPDTYYVLSCNIPLDNSNKATITIGQDNCYTSNPIIVLTDNTGELIITLNETEYYTTGAELVTIVNDERQVNYEIQLEKGTNQTASDTPTTYEPFILPNVKNGTILSTLTANGGFELGITDRSNYDKPNLITLRDHTGNAVIAGLSFDGVEPTDYHMYTLVGTTDNNVSTIKLYVDGELIVNSFSYTVDSTNTKINICKTLDSNGNVVCSDHIIDIKFMAFGTTPHTNIQIYDNVTASGNPVDMYDINRYVIPDYTVTELFSEDFVSKNVTCVNGAEVITNSEFHLTNGTVINIPLHTETFTIRNRFGNKMSLSFYALIYNNSDDNNGSGTIIDITDSYKVNEELCFMPATNAHRLKFVINKGSADTGNLLYADVIWNKDNKKYEIKDNIVWEAGSISTSTGANINGNSIIRTGYITIPNHTDSVMFEGIMKDTTPIQYIIFAYDENYNYISNYNNLITNGFGWNNNRTNINLLFNTQRDIKYIRVIAQEETADINISNILNTKLIFTNRNDIITLTDTDWHQYDGNYGSTYSGNFEPPINSVTTNNSLYYGDVTNSGYIDISNTNYIVFNTKLKGSKAADEFRYAVYFYDVNKNYINVDNYVSYWLSDLAVINIVGTIFANAKYIRILLKDNTGNITTSDIDTSYIALVKNSNVLKDVARSPEEILAELDERTTVLETDNVNIKNDLSDIEADTTDLTDSASYVSGQVTTITSDIEDLKSDLLYLS